MSENYESKKQTIAENKKRSGTYKTNKIKATDYLPSVFNTPLNQKWMDATLDQMISKGSLEDIDAYVGSRRGRHASQGDVYLKEASNTAVRRNRQLEPSIITSLVDKTTNSMLTPDDIANSVGIDFDSYSYNSAYNAQTYSFAPPIDNDKFVNYSSYYWVSDMPIYESDNTNGTGTYTTDLVTDVNGKTAHTFIDDNKTFELEDGMLIKLVSGYGAINLNTYLVTGVGNSIKLQLHTEYHTTNSRYERIWTDDSRYKDIVGQYWDNDKITTWASSLTFQGADPRGFASASALINAYNTQVVAKTAPPLLYFYDGGLEKKSYISNDMIYKLDSDWSAIQPVLAQTESQIKLGEVYTITTVGTTNWTNLGASSATVGVTFRATNNGSAGTGKATYYKGDYLDQFKIYQASIAADGQISTTVLVSARYKDEASGDFSVFQLLPASLTQAQKDFVNDMWDGESWDRDYLTTSVKDYLIISTRDDTGTIWSRGNFWIHKDTLQSLEDIVLGYTAATHTIDSLQAKRPIIEFKSDLHLFNNYKSTLGQWQGPVSAVLKAKTDSINMQVGSKFVLLNDQNIYKIVKTPSIAATSVASGFVYEITTAGTTDFTTVGSTSNAVGTVFLATGTPTGTGVVTRIFDIHTAMVTGDSLLALSSPGYITSNREQYALEDLVFNGTSVITGQQKTAVNQAPLFLVWDDAGVELKDTTKYPGNSFAGNKLFGYKVGTGTADTELGFALTYKDTGSKADYVFEVFLHTLTSEYNVSTSTGGLIGGNRNVEGLFSYGCGTDRQHIYVPSIMNLGAKSESQVTVTDGTVNATVPVGHSNWRKTSAYWVYATGAIQNGFSVAQKFNDGLTTERRKVHPEIVLVQGEATVFHDLIGDAGSNTLKIYAEDKTTVLSSAQGVLYYDENGDGFNETVYFTPAANGIYYYGYSTAANHELARIVVVADLDTHFHNLYIDGKWTAPASYTISSTAITVPASLLSDTSIIDVEYYNNDSQLLSSNPLDVETHSHNANNRMIETLTITETLGHWESKIRSVIGFTGLSYGNNNSYKKTKVTGLGGEIFIHQEPSLMHDLNYADNRINIKESLAAQGRDWWAFKRRFESQVKRLYSTNSYTTTKAIVNDAINAISSTKKGSKLHQFSNMVYAYDDKVQTIECVVAQTVYITNYTANSDFTQRDHVYVYLTDQQTLTGGSIAYVQRMLVKDVDYTFAGNTLTLLITPVTGSSTPTLDIVWHDMDYDCHIPASIAKLGMSNATQPQLSGTTIIGHDGCEYAFTSGAKLDNPLDSKYDVVNAAYYELEKRVYAGIVENENTVSANKYMPSPSNGHWYTLADMDLYAEQHFADWKAKTGVTSLNPTGYYNNADDTTWNYNTIVFGNNFTGNKLPGHWKGAYTVLFGTPTPHLTPWHMLGHSNKPSWWDTNYSWTNASKRTALLKALNQGHVNNPAENHINDINYANVYWDFATKCPVDSSGNLVARSTILGTPSNVNKAAPFVFGDWGPVEYIWRSSSLGHSTLVDTAVKLNPNEAFNEFFQPGTVKHTADKSISKEVYHVGSKLISPIDVIYSGKKYGKKIKSLKVVSSTTGYVAAATIDMLDLISRKSASATLDIQGGTIVGVALTNRGIDYNAKPIIDIINGSSVANVYTELAIETVEIAERTNGINEIQKNNLDRNFYTDDLEQQYYSLGTQLVQKVSGFTNKNLLTFKTESGPKGEYRINENDFDLNMYSGVPTEIITASDVTITKDGNNYIVTGLSSNKQRFKIKECIKDTNYSDVEVTTSSTVKKYSNFSTTASIVEFGTKLSKIQDIYDFVRGNRQYLETQGVTFEENKDAEALDVANWAVTAASGDVHTVFLGSKVTYKANHGYILEFDKLPNKTNGLLDTQGRAIDKSEVFIDRTSDSLTVTVNEDTFMEIGSVSFAEVNFEHVAVFKNITQFNDVLYNAVNNQRHYRLVVEGQRTKDWDGNKRAPGYLVFSKTVVENWDTSVQSIDDFYNYDIENVNQGVTKAESLTIGNVGRDWITNTNLPNSVFGEFYKGMIRDKGTTRVAQSFARSNLINGGESKVSLNEEWMFRMGYFGDTKNVNATEIALDIGTIKQKKHLVKFGSVTDANWVNNKKTSDVFEEISFQKHLEQTTFRTAGEVIVSEVKKAVFDVTSIGTVWDSTADYATIPTWNGQTSYKRRDLVRKDGVIYRLATASIGYDTTPTDLTFIGTEISPTFEYASQAAGNPASAIIDGTSIWFDETTRVFASLVATGTVGQTVASPSDITIDTLSIPLSYQPLTNQVDSSAAENGNPHITTGTLANPVIVDNTGKTLLINGATINMSNGGTIPVSTTANLTRAQIVLLINASDASGRLVASDTGTAIKIVYDVQNNAAGTLVIGAGTANTDLGLSVATYNPALIQSTVDSPMNPTIQAGLINANGSLPANIVASVSGTDQLVITKTATSSTAVGSGDSLTITGTAGPLNGFSATYGPMTFTDTPRPSSVSEAAASIVAASITGVTATTTGNRLTITSTNDNINLGSTTNEMNSTAGFPQTGIQYATATVIANVFTPKVSGVGDWSVVTADPTRFRIQVVDDSGIINNDSLTGTVKSKFEGWNVLQPHSFGYYTLGKAVDANGNDILDASGNVTYTSSCSICAGTATSDGNDAEVSISNSSKIPVAHGLEIGDYVMLVNTDTKPEVDGIHRVTALGDLNNPSKFYIDRFIETCGSAQEVYVLRNCRFEHKEALDTTIGSGANIAKYQWQSGDIAWTNYLTQSDANALINRGTYRWDYDGAAWTLNSARTVTTRPTNAKLERIVLYDNATKTTQIELEIYDPVVGIIPGVADREIDSKSPMDHAVYTNSTALGEFNEADTKNAWGEGRVGSTWWNTNSLVYYDYAQGSAEYRKNNWGNLFPGTEIKVYEWTKSTVAPDEWENAVSTSKEICGQVATGKAYSEFSSEFNEEIYYYSQLEDYNVNTGEYDPVYYFWVYDKTTIPSRSDRRLNVKSLASIISDPTANGIGWAAAIDDENLIISNVDAYVGTETVLQVNKKLDNGSHSNWTLLQEGNGIIPDYWYLGLRDNVLGKQLSTSIELPNLALHQYNRYGDDRSIAQSWYTNTLDARREAVSAANRMLQRMNLIGDIGGKWDRSIGLTNKVIDIEVSEKATADWTASKAYVVGNRVAYRREIYICKVAHTSSANFITDEPTNWKRAATVYDLTTMWEWTDYVSADKNLNAIPSVIINRPGLLAGIDTAKHQLVQIKIVKDGLDRDEIQSWNGTAWVMVEKKNATIKFNDTLYNPANIDSWDKNAWDNIAYDGNTDVYAYYFIKALRTDIFIDKYVDNFNLFFFAMIYHALADQQSVDWVYKTTYIELKLNTPVTSTLRRYRKNGVNELIGYVDTVKPFHSKIRNVFDAHTVLDEANTSVTEQQRKLVISSKLNDHNVQENTVANYAKNENRAVYSGTVVNGGTFATTPSNAYVGKAFTSSTAYDSIGNEVFLNASKGNERTTFRLQTLEDLAINVITNTSGSTVNANSRTLLYQQNNDLTLAAYSLEDANATTVTSEVSIILTTIPVTDGTKFGKTGFAYINGEIIHYGDVNGNNLQNITRGVGLTKAKKHATASTIVDITDSALTIDSGITTGGADPSTGKYQTEVLINGLGKSLLDSTATNRLPVQIQASTKGIEL